MNNRIKLAEAMGWKRGEVHTVAVMGSPIAAQRWIDPEGNDRAPSSLPNPYKYANDCEALIDWLCTNHRIVVVVMHHTNDELGRHRVNFAYSGLDEPVIYCDDYKSAVCELALKVLDD